MKVFVAIFLLTIVTMLNFQFLMNILPLTIHFCKSCAFVVNGLLFCIYVVIHTTNGFKNVRHLFRYKYYIHLFWNQTCTTLMSNPVSWLSCSLTCLAGFGLLLYAIFSVSNCLAVIVVLGRLFGWSPSKHPPSKKFFLHIPQCTFIRNFHIYWKHRPLVFAAS